MEAIEKKQKTKFGIYETSLVAVKNQTILYVTIPYKGCSKKPRCLFCGVQENQSRNLEINKEFGNDVLFKIKEYVNFYKPDSLVLYNGGNILRKREMFQSTITKDIPKFLSTNKFCNSYEIEILVKDVIKNEKKLKDIQKNLKDKKLKVRLAIEYLDNKLLQKNLKGFLKKEVDSAVDTLNDLNIRWNGYLLLGGLDLTQEEAIKVAVKTGKYMINKNAFKISINGVFITKRMNGIFKKRIYTPTIHDLVTVLEKLFNYKKKKNIIFKTGFEEENIDNIIKLAFVSNLKQFEEIKESIEKFNNTQELKYLYNSSSF